MERSTHPVVTDVIVIGAGQTGLAAAYHLKRLGIDHRVLERGARVGNQWRDRYDSLRLYSPAPDDALPGLPFPPVADRYPTGREMGDYLETYAAHHRLPVETGTRADRLERADGDGLYSVRSGAREYRAPNVILATGAFQQPRIPALAAQLDPTIRQLHSSEYRNPAQLEDGPALVVGLSHSGSDIAMELTTSRTTHLSGRRHGQLPVPIDSPIGRHVVWPLLKFLGSTVFTVRTPVGRRMAPHIRAGGAPLLRNRMPELRRAGVIWHEDRTIGARDGLPQLADGSVLDVRNVVWCTGFRPAFGWVDLPITGEDGWPRQDRGIVTDAPGLYLLGMPFLFGFDSVLVVGASHDARHVVEHIRGRLAVGAAAA